MKVKFVKTPSAYYLGTLNSSTSSPQVGDPIQVVVPSMVPGGQIV